MSASAKQYGPWAVVVGGSRGFGLAWARGIARIGINTILVADDSEELDAAKQAVLAAYPERECRTLMVDLRAADAPKRIDQFTEFMDVGLIVCNATAVDLGGFLEKPLHDHLDIVRVNMAATVALVHVFAGRMRRGGRGGIVLMSSLTAVVGTPFVATYGASKSFLLCFGEAIGAELESSGVDVLVVAPGATATPGMLNSLKPGAKSPGTMLDPDDVVRKSLSLLGRRRVYIPGFFNRVIAFLFARVLPRALSVRLLGHETKKLYGE